MNKGRKRADRGFGSACEVLQSDQTLKFEGSPVPENPSAIVLAGRSEDSLVTYTRDLLCVSTKASACMATAFDQLEREPRHRLRRLCSNSGQMEGRVLGQGSGDVR